MALQPGDRFGRYELAELLGKGGMGEVYRANDTLLHRRVALKVLRAAPGENESARTPTASGGAARILREARAAAGLTHPNAISIYDVGEVDGVPFLAMEFVPGRTLRTFVGDPEVTLARRIRWLIDVARALGAAHELGLVHRDIKPENVMVRDDGVIKVLDFGIARRTKTAVDPQGATGSADFGTLTAEGLVVGTPFYMAPEQMRGEPLDGRADQFAWGVVAYELLTGALPWDRDLTALQLVAQILSRDVEPAVSRNPEIPPAVDAVLRMALSKAAAHRFARMEEIADELEPHAALAGHTGGRSPSRRTGMTDPEIALAPTEVVHTPSGPRSQNQSTRSPLVTAAEAPRARRPPWRISLVIAAAIAAGALVASVASRRAPATPGPADAALRVETESQMSANAEATAAYRAGMQAFRDASIDTAVQQLDRAIQLDPSFAVAHLRRALLSYEQVRPEIREHLQAARNARASLGTHDLVLLDAMEPWALAPPDLRESQRRFEAAVKKYPADADLAFQLGWTLHHAYQRTQAAAAFDDALAKDPKLAMAWCMKARELVGLDEVPKALEAYGECVKVSPGATSCLEDVSSIQGKEGQCADMASTCRRFIGVAPDAASGYGCLAQALLAQGEPVDAARAALQQKWDRTPEGKRRKTRLRDEASLAALTGHFDEATRANHELEELVESAPDNLAHFMPAYWRMLIDLETGDSADVGRAGEDYLRSRTAWLADDFSFDLSILVYNAELAAGRLTRERFGELRDEWLAGDDKRVERTGIVSAPYAGPRWALAYALPSSSAAEAAFAISKRPRVRPLVDVLTDVSYCDQPIGRMFGLAGELDSAIHYSERAANSCFVLSALGPMFTTWATLDTGKAREARGDTDAACTAYQAVLRRWGTAQPSSRAATKARTRLGSLNCTP